MSDQLREMLVMDIEALSRKLVTLLPATEEVILAAGSLRAASHILGAALSTRAAMPTEVAHRPPVPDNPGGMDISRVAAEVAARMGDNGPPGRDLRKQWAGSLPSISAPSVAGGARKSKSKPIPVVASDANCPGCGEPAGGHAREKATPQDSEGRSVHVLCGGVRVRCHTLEE